MQTKRQAQPCPITLMKVVLNSQSAPDGSHYWDLTGGDTYEVLGIECDLYRILDDQNEPILFHPICFEVIDSKQPENWISSVKDGARYAYPPGWGVPGFFEAWHQRHPLVRRIFWQGLEQWYPETFQEREFRTVATPDGIIPELAFEMAPRTGPLLERIQALEAELADVKIRLALLETKTKR
jgi:hypothetical protein